jgi:hypothetical protein
MPQGGDVVFPRKLGFFCSNELKVAIELEAKRKNRSISDVLRDICHLWALSRAPGKTMEFNDLGGRNGHAVTTRIPEQYKMCVEARAKMQNKTVNRYLLDLIVGDLEGRQPQPDPPQETAKVLPAALVRRIVI